MLGARVSDRVCEGYLFPPWLSGHGPARTEPSRLAAPDTCAEAVEVCMFRAFFRSKQWRYRAYGGSGAILILLIVQLQVALHINELNKRFYDVWSDPGDHDLPEAYAALLPFLWTGLTSSGEHPCVLCDLQVRAVVARSRDLPLSRPGADLAGADRRLQPADPGRCGPFYQGHGNHRADRGGFHVYPDRVRADSVGIKQRVSRCRSSRPFPARWSGCAC